MSIQSRHESRLLTAAEQELVAATRQPEIGKLSHKELVDLAKLLREHRDRAVAIGRRQRREMRGKADPRGAAPASDNTGTAAKAQILAQAVKRVNKEFNRVDEAETAPLTLVESARKALEMKRNARMTTHPGAGRTAGKGMKSNPSHADTVKMDPREIGRVSQATRVAQAHRDA